MTTCISEHDDIMVRYTLKQRRFDNIELTYWKPTQSEYKINTNTHSLEYFRTEFHVLHWGHRFFVFIMYTESLFFFRFTWRIVFHCLTILRIIIFASCTSSITVYSFKLRDFRIRRNSMEINFKSRTSIEFKVHSDCRWFIGYSNSICCQRWRKRFQVQIWAKKK